MQRREFLRRLTLALAAGWAWGRVSRPVNVLAAAPELRLAILADAHLKDGNDRRAAARALARAVAEIRAMPARPDLVLFAGDLAHDGNPQALGLGKEIFSDLPASVWTVRGEGDGSPESPHWRRLFGDPGFSRSFNGVNILGLYTYPRRSSNGLAFELGQTQVARLAGELPRLDPAAPLIVMSHAPLIPVFRPWGQWTIDGGRVASLLARLPHVVYLHGHVHRAFFRGQGSGARGQGFETRTPGLFTENRKPKTENSLPLPATAWPLPSPLEGTPAALVPGLGPQGCGWALATLRTDSWQFQPRVWQA
jgi:hypothetical protein